MSGILAAVGPSVPALDGASIDELLGTMARRGADETARWRSARAILAVGRDRWEMEHGFAGPTLVASRGDCHVVCDASLYYVTDLKHHLKAAGVAPASDAAADLIVAAYLAFGARCVDYLEGDFAFCVWDERVETLFCARDPFGIRSLFHMDLNGTHFVASTSHPLVRRQGRDAAFDRRGVLRSILVTPGDGTETGWSGIHALPGAHALTVSTSGREVRRYWRAARSAEWARLGPAEAALALSDLLDRAARERQHMGGTALAMSGGMDSTAVLACLDHGGGAEMGTDIDILSYKVPEGDSGNEDWYVNLTASSFDLPVHWVEVVGIDFFADAAARAALRSDANGHLFEGYNRALASTALSLGDRVLMNGHGGDNLFAATDVAMADLLRTGHWLRLRRYFRDRGYRGAGEAITHVLRPALPLGVLDLLERFLDRHICSRLWERPRPPWIVAEPDLLMGIVVDDREAYDESIVRHQSTVLLRHRSWALMDSVFQLICTALFDLTRDEGVELRMPFFDRRLVSFAMSRPVDELNLPGRRKIVLENAMKRRLPDRTREPQAGGLKPGTFVGMMQSRWTPNASDYLRRMSGPWISEDLGLVDAGVFRRTLAERGGPHWRSARDTTLTLLCETWLRVWGEVGNRPGPSHRTHEIATR